MHEMRFGCVFFAMMACAVATNSVSLAQAPPSRPSKIAVRVPPRAFGVGDEANLLIGLMDASNQVAEATKAMDVEVECSFPSGKTKSWKVHFKPGESSQRLHVPLLETGAMEITAKHRELMDGGNLINVMDERPAEILPKRAAESEPTRPDVQPSGGAPSASAAHDTPPLPTAGESGLGTGTGGGGGRRPAPVAAPGTERAGDGNGASKWEPTLSLKYVPRRKIWADEKDSATIYAHLGPNDIAKWDMYIYLISSNGRITPNPLIISKGQSLTTASLVSDRPMPASVEFLSSSPWAKLLAGEKIDVSFAPALTNLKLKASPPVISLFEQTELVVELMDAHMRTTATDEPRSIFFAMENGRGQFQNTEVVIPAGRYEARTLFFPTWRGLVNISASTASLPEEVVNLRVTLPVLLVAVSVVGGFLGGLLAYWARKESKQQRIAVGVITGFVLYWGFLFGVMPLLPQFPHAYVLNPFSALVLTILGGWIGTEVFTPLMKRLGL